MIGLAGNSILNSLISGIAGSAVSSVVGAITGDSSRQALGNAEQQANFTDLLSSAADGSININTQTPDISALASIAQPVINAVQDQVTNLTDASGGVISNITNGLNKLSENKIIDPSTLSDIEKILSDVPVVIEEVKTDITSDVNQVAAIVNNSGELLQASSLTPQSPSDDASKALSVSDSSKVVSTPVSDELAAQQSLIPKKEDPRILGEDNLKSMTDNAGNKILKDLNSVVEKGVFAENQFTQKLESKKENSNSIISESSGAISELQKKEYADSIYKIDATKQKPAFAANENYGYKVVSVSKNHNTIDLKLEPETLGKLQIKLGFNADGKATLVVTADRQDTLDLLKKDVAGFEKILGDNGIKSDSGSMSFNLKEQNQQNQQWTFFEKPVAFNLQDLVNESQIANEPRISSSAYGNNYSNNLVSILV